LSTTLHWAALLFYMAGTMLYLGFVLVQKKPLHKSGQWVLWSGWGLHTLALISAWVDLGVFPAVNLRQSLDIFSWALMGAGMLVNLRLGIMILGAVLGPAAALLLLAASVLPQITGQPGELLKSIWMPVHIITVFLGFGLLFLNYISSWLYLMQERQIRNKSLGPLFSRLPSLSRLDELSQSALVLGFAFMTLGMMSGAVFAQIALGSYWRWDPKEVWSLITWLMYAGLMHTRLVKGWRGRKGAWFSIWAFAILIFTFLGVGLLFSGYHNLGTIVELGVPKP
jgi:cytochrome c-type biogenesis protein CcsB